MSPYGFLVGPVYENAYHICKTQGGLTANVKLHFFDCLSYLELTGSICHSRRDRQKAKKSSNHGLRAVYKLNGLLLDSIG